MTTRKRMNPKRTVFLILGCISFALGAIGIFVPIFPTFPFMLLALFFFGRSSEKLYAWFVNSKFYKETLKSYIEGRGMTTRAKVRILLSVSTLLVFGFFFMRDILVGKIILGIVWLCHIIYFGFIVKTIPEENSPR